jgi:murein DD-endopeptidase MepM/ murein hydrolase activator NlpD
MRNRVTGVFIVRENVDKPPKMLKVNAFVEFLFRLVIAIFVLSVLVMVVGSSMFLQRIVSYENLRKERDSLALQLREVDTLRENMAKINRFLEYFKMISANDGSRLPPTIDEYMQNIAPSSSIKISNSQREFRRIPRLRPVTGIISQSFSKTHEAIDFVAPMGSPIRATADGVVSKVYFDADLGNVVVLKHSDGYETLYAHCREILTKEVGTSVVQGETVAFVGTSGSTAKGVHLHYEIIKDGKAIDPEKLFL